MVGSKQLSVAAVAAVLACCAVGAQADLDFSRVHFVDRVGDNFLFRGNMPTNATTFAYDQLVGYMRQRAGTEGNTSLPDTFYMNVISLNNIFDGKDFKHEVEFWKDPAHASLGQFINWPLGLAALLPPTLYSKSTQEKMAATDGVVWKFDKIPERVATIRSMLTTAKSTPQVIYVHCTAGCDRTGEMIGSYRMQYTFGTQIHNVTGMYAKDVAECGRPPNYFSTTALEWYCLHQEFATKEALGDCTGFAKCKMFGHCEPTTPPAHAAAHTDKDAREQQPHMPAFELPLEMMARLQTTS